MKLRTVSEHMRSMSDVIAIHARHGELAGALGGKNGSLRFSIDTDDVSVETQWTGITIPTQGKQGFFCSRASLLIAMLRFCLNDSYTADSGHARARRTRSRAMVRSACLHARLSQVPLQPCSLQQHYRLSVLDVLRLTLFNELTRYWLLGICEDHCMILYVYIGDVTDAGGVLTFYIPARITGD